MSRTQQLRVLVVDTDEAAAVRVSRFLAAEGHHAEHESDATHVVDALKHGRHQLVVLDLGKPVDEGVQLLQRIKSANSDVCVVAMTERPSIESAIACMKLGAFDYLSRPFEAERLRPLIDEAIRRHGLRVDAEQQLNAAIGSQVRQRRVAAGLTLKQLANRTGLSVSLISQIELGRSAASMSTLYKLATALSVKLVHLFETV